MVKIISVAGTKTDHIIHSLKDPAPICRAFGADRVDMAFDYADTIKRGDKIDIALCKRCAKIAHLQPVVESHYLVTALNVGWAEVHANESEFLPATPERERRILEAISRSRIRCDMAAHPVVTGWIAT